MVLRISGRRGKEKGKKVCVDEREMRQCVGLPKTMRENGK